MKKSMMLTDFALACALCALAVFSAFLPFDADAPRWWRVVARMITLAVTALLYCRQYGERKLFPLRLLCVAVCLFWTGIFILTFMQPGSALDQIWYMQYMQRSVVHLWGLSVALYQLAVGIRFRRAGGRALLPAYSGSGLRRLLPVSYPHLGRAGRCIYVLYQFAVPGACGRVLAPGADGSAADVSGPQPSATAKRFCGLFEKIYSAYRQ